MKIHIGCGKDPRKGYETCDIRALDCVDIVCPAWELSKHANGVEEIYSRHMVEHLTRSEFICTIKDWYKSLKQGGSLHIICPDLDYHMDQLRNVVWTDEVWDHAWSNGKHGLAGIYGSQSECQPNHRNYKSKTKYWDVHKFGYTAGLMEYLLKKYGFINVECTTDKAHLIAKARKP